GLLSSGPSLAWLCEAVKAAIALLSCALVCGDRLMLTLGNFSLFLALAAIGAWLWRAHGLREHALALVRRHCQRLDVELLDGNVAFRRLAWLPDARGQRRLARIYDFEFTVTGEQ